MNRVQFPPGLSMAEFLTCYGGKAQYEAALVTERWRNSLGLPVCGAKDRSTFLWQGRWYW